MELCALSMHRYSSCLTHPYVRLFDPGEFVEAIRILIQVCWAAIAYAHAGIEPEGNDTQVHIERAW